MFFLLFTLFLLWLPLAHAQAPKTSLLQEDVGYVNAAHYGAAQTDVTLANALTQIASQNLSCKAVKACTLFLATGTWTITTNVTTPDYVVLWVPSGTILALQGGVTLTVNGGFRAEVSQVFSGAGTVAFGPHVPVLYPQWWGATGDGSTDDTAALQSALSSVNTSTGAVVLVPPGTYCLGHDLRIGTNHTTLRGSGPNATTLKVCQFWNTPLVSGATPGMVSLIATGVGNGGLPVLYVTDVTIEGFTFLGGATPTDSQTPRGIVASYTGDVTIQHNRFTNMGRESVLTGQEANPPFRWRVVDNVFDTSQNGITYYAVDFLGQYSEISRNRFASVGSAIHVNLNQNLVAENQVTSTSGNGITVGGLSSASLNNLVTGNVLSLTGLANGQGAVYGVLLDTGSNQAIVSNNLISITTLSGGDYIRGITAQNSQPHVIKGNTIALSALVDLASGKNIVGIEAEAVSAATFVLIASNDVVLNGGSPNTIAFGVFSSSLGPTLSTIVRHNLFRGFVTTNSHYALFLGGGAVAFYIAEDNIADSGYHFYAPGPAFAGVDWIPVCRSSFSGATTCNAP